MKNKEWGVFFHFKMLRAASYSFKALEDLPDDNLALLKYSSWILFAVFST